MDPRVSANDISSEPRQHAANRRQCLMNKIVPVIMGLTERQCEQLADAIEQGKDLRGFQWNT